jgi:hypothetical protein
MTTNTWSCKAGDKHRQIGLDLTSITTTGALSVRFRMTNRATGALVVDADGVIASASRVTYQFTGTQLDVVGYYDLEAALTYPDGPETVPTEGFVTVVIGPKLG